MKKFIAFALCAASALAFNSSFFIDLNSNDLEGGFETVSKISSNSNVYLGMKALRAQDEYKDMQTMASGHIRAIGATPIRGFSAGVGIRAVGAWIGRGSSEKLFFAAPLEAGVIYTLPIVINTSISAFYDLAPNALCFKNCDRYTELRFEAAIEPIDGGMIFAGWRDIDFKRDKEYGKYEFNRAFYGGIRLSF